MSYSLLLLHNASGHVKIQIIKIPTALLKLSSDDTQLINKSKQSTRKAFEMFEIFGKASGFKHTCNFNKKKNA